MFYVAPLFLIALLVWIDARRCPAARSAATAAIVVAAGAARRAPVLEHLIDLNAVSDTIGAAPALVARRARALGLDDVALVVVLRRARRRRAALPVRAAALRARAAAARARLLRRLAAADRGEASAAASLGVAVRRHHRPRTATGSTARSGATRRCRAIWTGNTDKYTIWENEFFNRSVGTVYDDRRRRCRGDLPETPVTVDRAPALRSPDGQAVRARLRARRQLASRSTGRSIAQDARKGMVLYRAERAAAPDLARRRASTRRTRGPGTNAHVHAPRLQGRHAHRPAAERPEPVHAAEHGRHGDA